MFIQIIFKRFIVLWNSKELISKVHFTSSLKHKDKKKKKMEMLSKNPQSHEGVSNEVSVYEQKPIKIDDFNEIEEKEIKERVEKRKMKRREVTENNKLLKKKEQEDNKKETEMFTRLRELNNDFKNIKEQKRNNKKMSKTIIKI